MHNSFLLINKKALSVWKGLFVFGMEYFDSEILKK
jgi:hypothetical protein